MPTWLALSLVSVFASTFSNVWQKKASDTGVHFAAISFFFQIVCGLLVLGVSLIYGFEIPPIQEMPWQFFIMSIGYAGGTVFLFLALKTITASQATIYKAFATLCTALLAYIFLTEKLSVINIAGMFLVLAAILIASYTKGAFSVSRGTGYALLSSALYACAIVADGLILKTFPNVLSYIVFAFIFPGVLIAMAFPRQMGEVRKLFTAQTLPTMMILAVAYAFAAVTFYFAFISGGLLSQIATISRSNIILTVIVAALFLGEREHIGKTIAAAAITVLGVVLISQ